MCDASRQAAPAFAFRAVLRWQHHPACDSSTRTEPARLAQTAAQRCHPPPPHAPSVSAAVVHHFHPLTTQSRGCTSAVQMRKAAAARHCYAMPHASAQRPVCGTRALPSGVRTLLRRARAHVRHHDCDTAYHLRSQTIQTIAAAHKVWGAALGVRTTCTRAPVSSAGILSSSATNASLLTLNAINGLASPARR